MSKMCSNYAYFIFALFELSCLWYRLCCLGDGSRKCALVWRTCSKWLQQ